MCTVLQYFVFIGAIELFIPEFSTDRTHYVHFYTLLGFDLLRYRFKPTQFIQMM